MSTSVKAVQAHPTTVTNEALIDASGDATFREMLHGFLALTARLEAIRYNLGRILGITGIQFTMLMSIYHLAEKSSVHISSVAKHLHLSGAFVTIETGKLAKAEIIQKVKDPHDGRKMRLEITPATRSRLAKLAGVQQQVNDLMFSTFKKRDFRGLAKGIELMMDNCDAAVRLSGFISDNANQRNSEH